MKCSECGTTTAIVLKEDEKGIITPVCELCYLDPKFDESIIVVHRTKPVGGSQGQYPDGRCAPG